MSGKLYLKNRLPIILLNLLGVLALSLFLLAAGNDIQTVLLILGVWILVLTCTLPPVISPGRSGWICCWRWPGSWRSGI